ncbi:hypothetical protein ACLB2K_004222 [Fragaria x ananassa]
MLGAWSSEATSRTLQDVTIYGRYEQWMARHGRVFSSIDEKESRFKIFKENLAYIESSNNDASKTYRLGVNQFAHLTNEEFTSLSNGFKGHESSTKTSSFRYENVTVPATMDWRSKGAVTPIKNQGQCFVLVNVTGTQICMYRLLLGIFGSGSHGRDYSTYNG